MRMLIDAGQAFGVGDQPIGSVRLERALSGMQVRPRFGGLLNVVV